MFYMSKCLASSEVQSMNKPKSKNMVVVCCVPFFLGFCDVSFNSWWNRIWNGLIPIGKIE